MNLQPIGGSDYFGTVHWSALDLGGPLSSNSIMRWTDPEPIAANVIRSRSLHSGRLESIPNGDV